jgi:hypothetical protein
MCVTAFADSSDFTDESTKFNKDRAVFCLEHCIAADTEAGIKNKLSDEGFEDIRTYNYDIDTEDNSSFSLARKDRIVILTIRQTYDKEWYGNFNVADSGEGERHESFNKAAQNVVEATKEYIGDEKGYLIITGYSRGAAVANLAARDLKDSASKIFAYTFATPAVTTNIDEKCDYIFNVINPEDFITMCPLSQWGYKRYGTDVLLPVSTEDNFTELYKNMNEEYKSLTGTSYKYYGNDEPTQFIETAYALAQDVSEYNEKEYFVYSFGDTTLREYFGKIAALLCEDSGSKEWEEAYQFLQNTNGTKFNSLTKFVSDNYLSGKIFDAHNANTYYSWLLTLDESYFENTKMGDADCDGIVTANDAALVLEKSLNSDFELKVEKYSNYMDFIDMDGNNIIDANDAVQILELSLG